jgi:hypothetical protein
VDGSTWLLLAPDHAIACARPGCPEYVSNVPHRADRRFCSSACRIIEHQRRFRAAHPGYWRTRRRPRADS